MMRFTCDTCKTKYAISDDKVRKKILKIVCQKCGAPIFVAERGRREFPRAVDDTGVKARVIERKAPVLPPALPIEPLPERQQMPMTSGFFQRSDTRQEWFVREEHATVGPYSLSELKGRLRQLRYGLDAYVWQPAFAYKWRRVRDVPALRVAVPADATGSHGGAPDAGQTGASVASPLFQMFRPEGRRSQSPSPSLMPPGSLPVREPSYRVVAEMSYRNVSVAASVSAGNALAQALIPDYAPSTEPIPQLAQQPLPQERSAPEAQLGIAAIDAAAHRHPSLWLIVGVVGCVVAITVLLFWRFWPQAQQSPGKPSQRRVIVLPTELPPAQPTVISPQLKELPQPLDVEPRPIEGSTLANQKPQVPRQTPPGVKLSAPRRLLRTPTHSQKRIKQVSHTPGAHPPLKSVTPAPQTVVHPNLRGVEETNIASVRKSLGTVEPTPPPTPRPVSIRDDALKVSKSRLVRRLGRCMSAGSRLGIHGKFIVGFTVATTGRPTEIALPTNLGAGGVRACLRSTLQRFTFPERSNVSRQRIILISSP